MVFGKNDTFQKKPEYVCIIFSKIPKIALDDVHNFVSLLLCQAQGIQFRWDAFVWIFISWFHIFVATLYGISEADKWHDGPIAWCKPEIAQSSSFSLSVSLFRIRAMISTFFFVIAH